MKRTLFNRADTYPARKQKKENPMADPLPNPIPIPYPAEETVQKNLAAGRVQAEQPEIEAARALLQSLAPAAQVGLARRKAWLDSPVLPWVNRNENFPPWPSVADLRACANRQRVGDPAIPSFLAELFIQYRDKVNADADEAPKAAAALAAIPKLTPAQCARDRQCRATNVWGPSTIIGQYAADLSRITAGDDLLGDAARGLAQSLFFLVNASRSLAAAGVPRPATTACAPGDGGPSPTVTEFDVFDHR